VQRPPRPFGVTLAILASLILFTVFPLLQVGMLLVVQSHFAGMTFDDAGLQPIVMGADILGVPTSRVVIQATIAIVFLIIAFFAWRGRPPAMRFVLMLSCVALTLYSVISAILAQIGTYTQEFGASSLDSILNSVAIGQFALGILVTLYVVWYLNRGPARAFYRGYYLPVPDTESVSSSP
jgi:hypothetical protein